jgi:hypothetical protein
MTRICPFCKSKLGLYDRYFCTSCGNTLPVELAESSSSPKKVIRHEVKNSSKLSINFEKTVKLLVVTLPAFALVLILYRFLLPIITEKKMILDSSGIKESTQSTGSKRVELDKTADRPVSERSVVNPVVVASRNVIILDTSLLTGNLIDPDLGKLIPYEVDLYMESNDSKTFLGEIINSEVVSDGKFKEFYEVQKSNFLGSAGFFVTKTSSDYIYGIAFMLKDISDKSTVSEEYNISFIGSRAVLVSSKSSMKEIQEVGKGLEKNLVLNPIYASAKATVPNEGKLFILPITKNGEGFLYQLLEKKLTDDLSSIVNSFLDSKLDYAVVL